MYDAKELRNRRERLGRRASYSILARMVGRDKKAVYQALNERVAVVPMNVPEILKDVDRALEEIEDGQDGPSALAA